MGAGPHLCHDISIRHVQVILVQFAEEVIGEESGPSGEHPILQQLPAFLWKASPPHAQPVWFPQGKLSIAGLGL